MAGLFERLAGRFAAGSKQDGDAALLSEAVDAIVDAVEPKVRMHSRYRQKLEPCVRKTISHLRGLARTPLEPVFLSRASWASDPRVNAFFATAADVPAVLGRSDELQSFFSGNETQEAYALLGMRKTETREETRTLVSFSDHRIVAPAATLEAARVELARRILLRLAQAALARIIAVDERAAELESRKAYLGARLRLLRLSEEKDTGDVERQLKETVDEYIDAKGSLATLDGTIGHIDEVFSHPERHVALTHTALRVDRLGVKVEGEATGPVNDLALAELSIGTGANAGTDLQAVIAVVRCPRAEMPSRADLIAQAERTL
jgi:hypothetical protein